MTDEIIRITDRHVKNASRQVIGIPENVAYAVKGGEITAGQVDQGNGNHSPIVDISLCYVNNDNSPNTLFRTKWSGQPDKGDLP